MERITATVVTYSGLGRNRGDLWLPIIIAPVAFNASLHSFVHSFIAVEFYPDTPSLRHVPASKQPKYQLLLDSIWKYQREADAF